MTRARISILNQSGDVELKEPERYTALNTQDTWDEYGSVTHAMHNNAKQYNAPQELKDDLSKLRLDLIQAHQSKSTPMPTHDEFVAVVEEYNAWVKTQSLHLDPTTATPATVVADPPAASPAPSTTAHETTPPPVSTTTPVVDEEKAENNSIAEVLAILRGEDGVKARSDAHHVTLYGDGAGNPGLDARVKALENGNVLQGDGTSVPWHSRTVAVGNYDLRVVPAILAFVVTYALLILISWVIDTDTGFWATIGYWQAGIAAAVAALVLLITNSHRNTAPAVEREERV